MLAMLVLLMVVKPTLTMPPEPIRGIYAGANLYTQHPPKSRHKQHRAKQTSKETPCPRF
jgi:hypothetical protein